MANKTQPTGNDVMEFIDRFANTHQKKEDSYKLIELMSDISGFEPTMWGPSIIGFGAYHYKYDSGHEGDAPLIGFSPRKAAISLYVFTGLDKHAHLLEGLGKFKMGKACIYVKRLSDIDTGCLSVLMQETIVYLQQKYGKTP
jgi:hypothetical protein